MGAVFFLFDLHNINPVNDYKEEVQIFYLINRERIFFLLNFNRTLLEKYYIDQIIT